jgi:hypothetical protein
VKVAKILVTPRSRRRPSGRGRGRQLELPQQPGSFEELLAWLEEGAMPEIIFTAGVLLAAKYAGL